MRKTIKYMGTPTNNELFQKVENNRRISKILMIGSIVLLALVALVSFFAKCPDWLNSLLLIFSAFATSILAGSLVSYVIDMPAIIYAFRSLIINSLASDEYLESLPPARLQDIRKKTIKLIHKEATSVPESLLNIDTVLCDLIEKPYYSFYNESIVCHKKEPASVVFNNKEGSRPNDFYIVKDVDLEFEIRNPKGNTKALADIGLRKALDTGSHRLEEMFSIVSFELFIDENTPVFIYPEIRYFNKPSAKSNNIDAMAYDTHLSFSTPGNRTITADNCSEFSNTASCVYLANGTNRSTALVTEFEKSVRVKLKYRQVISSDDNHYTKRLRYAAKAFMLYYSSEDNVKLHGQILGTNIAQKNVSLLRSDDKHITIQCRDWLLPGDGTFIVADDKIK